MTSRLDSGSEIWSSERRREVLASLSGGQTGEVLMNEVDVQLVGLFEGSDARPH